MNNIYNYYNNSIIIKVVYLSRLYISILLINYIIKSNQIIMIAVHFKSTINNVTKS